MTKNSKKKETFTVAGKEYAVLRPSPDHVRQSTLYYNTAFSDAVKSKAMVRPALRSYMMEQGLWSNEKDKKEKEIRSKISELEVKIERGGINLNDAKTTALDIRRYRNELRELFLENNSLDSNTAEAQAENARFNMLVMLCLVYNDTGEQVYKTLDDYEKNSTEELAYTGAQQLAKILYDIDEDFEKSLIENRFLLKYKFVDDKLRLIDKQGRLVDVEGRLINEEGRYIDKDGKFVDINGIPVNENGDKIVEFSPFLDDDGNPILEEAEEPQEEEAAPPTTPPLA